MARFKRPHSQPQSGESAEQNAPEQEATTAYVRDEKLECRLAEMRLRCCRC
jgi:hypothetical protein